MIEQVSAGIYRIEVPLPHNPLKWLNSYFIRGGGRNLLIDTGFNQPECREAQAAARAELGFEMDNTDILVTHAHSDHTGLVQEFTRPGNIVYCDAHTARYYLGTDQAGRWQAFDDMRQQSGLPEIDLANHPGYKYGSVPLENPGQMHIIKDGDRLLVGDLELICISTPGHAPEHICLYLPSRRILFSGDHILGSITPNNTIWGGPWNAERDLLGEYLANLDKIASLDIELVLPSHREPLRDCRGRIAELKLHHQERLQEVLEILAAGKMNGEQVASRMSWSTKGKSWQDFPLSQKIFAVGEALSHLNHLVFTGQASNELSGGVVYYTLTDGPAVVG
jgi:glyoxylase-like metal-dependent hydrolase (beta-lactamase superfamily II)